VTGLRGSFTVASQVWERTGVLEFEMKALLGRLRRSFEDRFERRPEVAARAPGT
jgi:hypothetical protein